MKEVAGATALILDVSGTSRMMLALMYCQHGVPYLSEAQWSEQGLGSGAVPAGSIHSLYREGTFVTGSYW